MENQPNIFEKPVDDYLRLATASVQVEIANPRANAKNISDVYLKAKDEQAEVVVLQELGVTGYTVADMVFNRRVLEESANTVSALAKITEEGPALIVGAPIQDKGVLYNCAVVLAEGKIAGVVPKTYLPNYNEFYEKRWFTSGKNIRERTIRINDEEVPFGTDLLFNVNGTNVGVEICEDGWATISPGTKAALQGAEVIVNLSASNELTAKAAFRRKLVTDHASRLLCAYAYTSAGKGESVADTVYSGHQLIAETGRLVNEIEPFNEGMLVYDIDREYIQADRMVNTTFSDEANDARADRQYRVIEIEVPKPSDNRLLREVIARPFGSDESCRQVFNIASQGLAEKILERPGTKSVIGLSGGLDSTLALILAIEAYRKTGTDISDIHTITMPGLASSERTQDNASLLAQALGTTHKVIPIKQISNSFLEVIGHDGQTEDITYENTQARTRTEILMNYANLVGGFVQGTGDLSEGAIGWCTFNGDHMSMYNPNAGVFKSMVKDVVKWYADTKAEPEVSRILYDILATPISPELTGNGDLSQVTEDKVGPYELHEFFQVEHQRHKSRPEKIGYLATQASFGTEYSQEEIEQILGETSFEDQEQDKYTDLELKKWLESFIERYFGSQWKRDAMPEGLMVGPVANSPRTTLRMAPNINPEAFKID